MAPFSPLRDANFEGSGPQEFTWALRCIHLVAGRGSQPIGCRLHSSTLGQSQRKYEALSYAWGDPTKDVEISLEGQPFMITKNLETALRRLRLPNENRTLWIDAICINQHDRAEVNLQVKRMWSVYRYASKVIVFLGEGTADTKHAVELINILSKGGIGLSHRRVTSLLFTKNAQPAKQALRSLMSGAWWSRAWVIQEFSVAAEVAFVCGDLEWSGESFSEALRTLVDVRFNAALPRGQGYFMREIASTPISHLMTARRDYQDSHSKNSKGAPTRDPLSLLYRFRSFKASDPRDKVYSLFHLIGEISLLQPNYSHPVRDLYIDVVKASITSSETLEILCHHNRTENCMLGLPTWCPDWTVQRGQRILLWQNDYAAGGDGSKTSARFEGDELQLDGKVMDRIEWAVPFEPKMFRKPGLVFDQIMTLQARVLERAPEFPKERKTTASLAEKFRRTLVGSRIRVRGPRHEATVLGQHEADKFWDAWYSSMIDQGSSGLHGTAKTYNDALYSALAGRVFFISEKGCMGLADNPAQAGDVLGIFAGSRVLFCLREQSTKSPKTTGNSRRKFNLVGECYLHDFMQGEGIPSGEILSPIYLT
ncbi:heterokaryon incompatibility protein-domain-containing protein [Colletotrichum godetiae]|uniref:Heterokaryon incompatibility protein-domain-containing protein n=1 Tax=Colletotrichum godetiae TaxID=1209918 RepID=A0AAJ0F1J9_9PEZI|nr:heterokaryon incompatibility protein-domain-containing protein [Colletotrichum godetiae]KAK1689608.1 heterokaryon incompatibility protein-domain-containing protein [Colletotrichum godetiae]